MKIQVRNNCSDFNSYRAARVKSLFNCESGANFAIDADLPLEDAAWQIVWWLARPGPVRRASGARSGPTLGFTTATTEALQTNRLLTPSLLRAALTMTDGRANLWWAWVACPHGCARTTP